MNYTSLLLTNIFSQMSVIIRQTTRRHIPEHKYLLTEKLATLNLGLLRNRAIFRILIRVIFAQFVRVHILMMVAEGTCVTSVR